MFRSTLRSTLFTATLLSAAAFTAPVLAQTARTATETGEMMRGPVITMSVTEKADAAPDVATISTGVETRAPTAKAAMAQNAAQIDTVVTALLKAGVERKDIQTSGINLNPQYDYSSRKDGEPPRFLGYIANNSLSVVVRKIDKAGETVDAMVNAGATNINGPVFSIADTSKLEAQARDKAIRTAADRAAAYAKAAGYGSARLLAISESGEFQPPIARPMMMKRDMAAASPVATTIEPGQLSTSITLSFRYMLER